MSGGDGDGGAEGTGEDGGEEEGVVDARDGAVNFRPERLGRIIDATACHKVRGRGGFTFFRRKRWL